MIVAQISDTHVCLDTPDAARRLDDFADTMADIGALDPGPDVIVHTGDVVHTGAPAEYAAAAAILAAAKCPVFAIPGNKDNRANLRAGLGQYGRFDPRSAFLDYAVDGFPVRLVLLDTLAEGSNKGDFCAARLRRLQDTLAERPAGPIAVFAHHPPFEVMVGPDRFHYDSLDAMEALRQGLRRGGRVAGLFCGHVHRATDGMVGEIPAIVMPCVATTLRRGDYPEAMRARPVYYIHRFDKSGGFSTEARIVVPALQLADGA
jgi:3',5'-cyclic AMP phosphodiesterase CpdA